MRKIISKKESEKKSKRNQLLVGIILIGVMIFSVLAYSFGADSGNPDSGAKISYNGFEFVQENGLWHVNIGNYQFSFLYTPREVMKINTTLKSLNSYKDQPLYIYSESPEAENEILRNLFYNTGFAQRVQNVCLEGEECGKDLPIKNCTENFIIIRESNETGIRQENNCVFIEGNRIILVGLSDSFLFKVLGIQ
jgi:hypothetical protein